MSKDIGETRVKPGDQIVLMLDEENVEVEIQADQKNMIMPLREPEKIALRESIQRQGVQIPMVVSVGPTRGRIIDGFNRWEVCTQLEMSCPILFKLYESVKEEDLAALDLNLQRRQMDDLTAGLLNIQLLELHGIHGRGKKSLSGMSVSDVAREAGQSERTFYRRIELARLITRPDCQDVVAAYRNEELTPSDAMTIARARKKAADEGGKGPTPRPGQSLKDVVNALKHPQISPLEQARMEAFSEGVRWGYESVKDEKADSDWVLEQLTNWRQSEFQREQAEKQEAAAQT